MAHAAGQYSQMGGNRPQFPAYAGNANAGIGSFYQQNRPLNFQYYAPAPPGAPQLGVARNAAPPPPPPPGESKVPSPLKNNPVAGGGSSFVPPLQPPPLPPMFPWMSPALAESMTGSQFGQNFREEANNLPFVPIIVNDADLAKMRENVIKEAEQVKSHQLQYYKDVMNLDLPQALKEMFQPLYCKLCTLTLSSPVVAKDHYSGKRHKKAVDAWVLKNPKLCTDRQRKEAADQPPGPSEPPPQSRSGPVMRTTLGQGTTGPINGFITKQNPQPSPPVQKQQEHRDPPPAQGSQSSFGFENNRKRTAFQAMTSQSQAGPPQSHAPSSTTTTNNQQKINHNQSQASATNISQPVRPPPAQTMGQNHENTNDGNGWDWQNPGDFNSKRPRREEETVARNPGPRAPPTAGSCPPVAGGSQAQKNNLGGERERTGGHGGGPPPKSMCEICNVQLSSKVMAEQHFNGKNHKARLAALQEGGSAPVIAPSIAANPAAPPKSGPPPPSPSQTIKANAPDTPAQVQGIVPQKSNITSKLLALSSGSLITSAPLQQIPPAEDEFEASFEDDNNPFNFNGPPANQPYNNSRGGGRGGGGGNRGGGFPRGGGGGGRGGHPGNRGGRGGGRGNLSNNNNNNRDGGGGGGGGGRGRGGGSFKNNNNNNNGNNFNNNNRFMRGRR